MEKQNLLLLPGLLCDAEVWQSQASHLSDDAHIIIPDLSHADTPDKMVAAVLEQAPNQFALAGHSMGGWVALEVMKKAPERVTKLCLANTTAKLDSKDKANARRDMISKARCGEYSQVIEQLANAFLHRKELLNSVRVMLERNQDALIFQQSAMLARDNCEAVLTSITCPTLVIHAEHDKVFQLDDSMQLTTSIPHARLAVITEAGHMSLMEQPDQFNSHLRNWLIYRN